MTNKLKWIVGGVAAVMVTGALFAVPVLAEEGVPVGFGRMSSLMSSVMGTSGTMSSMHGQMNGDMTAMHGQMGGDMMAMHDTMAPLMEQMPAMHEQVMGEVAGLLGMTLEQLDAAMAEGKSLTALAEEKNVAPAEIQNIMTRNMQSFLDKAVEAGTLTQEQADAMVQYHEEHSSECLTGDMMQNMMEHMGGMGDMGDMAEMHKQHHGSEDKN